MAHEGPNKHGYYCCPCCLYHTLSGRDSVGERCPVCGWIDNPAQLSNPAMTDGPNAHPLFESRCRFIPATDWGHDHLRAMLEPPRPANLPRLECPYYGLQQLRFIADSVRSASDLGMFVFAICNDGKHEQSESDWEWKLDWMYFESLGASLREAKGAGDSADAYRTVALSMLDALILE